MSGEENVVNGTVVTGTAGTAVDQGFGVTSMVRSAETASSAVAAQAKAAVEARFILALQRPRDLDAFRLAILKECRRPGFAATARYRKPVGEGVEGPSIRMAEACLRLMGNLSAETATIYEDPDKRIMRVSVTDLETNATYSGDVTIDKTVERATLKDGQTPISMRRNSVGKATYLVAATEDDLLNKQNALLSKQLRTLVIRLVPSDIMEEAMATVIATLERDDSADPAASRKKLVDGFDRIGVKPSALRDYLGHDLDGITPAEMVELRAVGAGIKEGESSWKEALEHKLKTRATPDGEKASTIKDKAKAKAAGKVETAAVVEEQGSLIDSPATTGTAA